MLPIPFLLSSQHRSVRSFTQDVTYLSNIIFQYTNPLPFETEAHSIHTMPLLREHLDSYLYYFRYKTLEIIPSQKPLQLIFNPIQDVNPGTFFRTFHPQNLTLSKQDVFISYIDKLIEHYENLDSPFYRPSHLESLKEKAHYFDVLYIDTKIQRHNNPHYWLQQDLLQVTNFQYKFFQNIILNDDTIPQIKVVSHFLLNYFRFNYQLIWEQTNQHAYVNFPRVNTDTEILPFIIKIDFKHSLYKDFTTFSTSLFEYIILNPDFIMEQSETDNRPYITNVPNSPFNTNLLQENLDDDENIIHHQPTTPRQPSQTTQDTAESLQNTLINPINTSTITDANAFQVPIHTITENTTILFN